MGKSKGGGSTHGGGDDDDDEEEFEGNPLVLMLFEFLKEPRSSRWALIWGRLLTVLVSIHILAIALETCDGPNQYTDRVDQSRYTFLLKADQYDTLNLLCMLPICADAFFRVVALLYLYFGKENIKIYNAFRNDHFTVGLFVMDIVGVFPFILNTIYIKPKKYVVPEGQRVILRIVELLTTSRILRITKDIPSIWAIRIALSKSGPHLVVPLFFFMVFNITVATIFYFVEPCYNDTSCMWHDLFDSSFYSVVSMTTTGYGNQWPMYELGRFVACCVMMFGALFLSMPLAIIGNEYEEAWSEVQERIEREKKEREAAARKRQELLKKYYTPLRLEGGGSDGLAGSGVDGKTDAANEKEKGVKGKKVKDGPSDAELLQIAANNSVIMETLRNFTAKVSELKNEAEYATRLTPVVLMHLLEIRAWLNPLTQHIKLAVDVLANDALAVQNVTNANAAPRRLSVLGGTVKAFTVGVGGGTSQPNPPAAIVASSTPAVAGSGGARQLIPEPSKSMWNSIMSVLGFANSHAAVRPSGLGGNESSQSVAEIETQKRLAEVALNPHFVKSRIWMIMEMPRSSREARTLQLLLISLILLSIFMLYTETLTSFKTYGESTHICGAILGLYCYDKSPDTDPGCYMQGYDGIQGPPYVPLRFGCSDDDCFGAGLNFGAGIDNTNATCGNSLNPPFQSSTSLAYNYGLPYLFTSRDKMHRINAICSRVECRLVGDAILEGNWYWVRGEFIINIIFTIELLFRLSVTSSIRAYLADKMNYFDILSIFPFYMEVTIASLDGEFNNIDFSIISSSPESLYLVVLRSLKIFRLFKLTRHFKASKVLSETANNSWRQILGIIGLLSFLVVMFAIMLFEVEAGTPHYVGDPGFTVPSSLDGIVHDGDRIVVNKNGAASQYSNVFYGVWFSLVTITTTGYGDVTPVTNGGQIMTILLMLLGACYMAVPLTAAASTFYQMHSKYLDKDLKEEKLRKQQERKYFEMMDAAKPNSDVTDQKTLQRIGQLQSNCIASLTKLDAFLDELQSPYVFKASPPIQKSAPLGKSPLLVRMTALVDGVSKIISSSQFDLNKLALLHVKKLKQLALVGQQDNLLDDNKEAEG